MKTLPFVILIAVAPHCFARIGDSPAKCAATYGEITDQRPDGGLITYRKDGVSTSCWFEGGVCTSLNYQLRSTGFVIRPEVGKEPRFSKSQSFALLNLNRGSSAWKQESKSKFGQAFDGIYRTEDGKLQANVNNVLINIESTAAYQRRLDQTKETMVDQTVRSFSAEAIADQPAVKHDAPLPPPSEFEVQMAEASKKMEASQKELATSLKNMEQGAERFKEHSAASDAALRSLSERLKKQEEVKQHKERYDEIAKQIAEAKTPEARKAAREKEAAWTVEANRLIAQYQALKSAP